MLMFAESLPWLRYFSQCFLSIILFNPHNHLTGRYNYYTHVTDKETGTGDLVSGGSIILTQTR